LTESRLNIQTFVEMRFGENSFVVSVADGAGRLVGWVVDPSFPPAVHRLLAYVAERGIVIEKIVLTHGHADHIVGVDVVREAHPGARLALAPADRPMLTDAERNLSAPFGLTLTVATTPDIDLTHGMELSLGPLAWRVLDTAGHSPGGISLYCLKAGVVFTGDALFAGSIGRTDFPGSSHPRLIDNIRRNLLTLPDETVVYSGHGPTTTIGIERKSNPFLSE